MQFTNDAILDLDNGYRRNLINSLHGFKSVSLVGTQNQQGQTNLAIFSQIFHLGAHPPLVGMLVRPHTVPRHTLENLLETKHYTLNHLTESIYLQGHHTSARWPGEQSEFEACGLTPQYHEGVQAPFVAESLVQIGLEYREHQTLAINDTVLVIGEVMLLRVPEGSVAADGFIDLEKAGTLTASGLDSYHTTRKVARLSYAKPDHKPVPIA